MKIRQDAWLEDNDTALAEIVIRHVKEGSTQLNAFEEASDQLKRTSAACGFRWNAVVRKQYEHQLAEAKQARKEKYRLLQAAKKRANHFLYAPLDNNSQQISLSSLSIDIVIAYLYKLQQQSGEIEQSRWKVIANQSQQKIEQLMQALENLEKENKQIKHDYEQFVSIMNRARKMVAFNSEDDLKVPTFTMERNGNLVANHFLQDEG